MEQLRSCTLQNFVQKINSDIERLIIGCLATWRIFMITSAFLEGNPIKITHSGDRFEISYEASAGNVTIKMTESLLITEYCLALQPRDRDRFARYSDASGAARQAVANEGVVSADF
jgi:hypothetical protein